MAFRVALSLVVVLLLAPPTSAQFSTEDVNGLRTVHATRVAVRQGADAGWLQGSVLFSRNSGCQPERRGRGRAGQRLRPGAGGLGVVLTVQWQAGAGSATPGDFTPASGSVTLGPSETRKIFTISALTDATAEEDESVTLTLSVPVGTATLGQATTTLSILDAPAVE